MNHLQKAINTIISSGIILRCGHNSDGEQDMVIRLPNNDRIEIILEPHKPDRFHADEVTGLIDGEYAEEHLG